MWKLVLSFFHRVRAGDIDPEEVERRARSETKLLIVNSNNLT